MPQSSCYDSHPKVLCALGTVCLASVLISGCGDGLTGNERKQKEEAQVIASLKNLGAKKVEPVTRPQGNSWSVDLSGATIDDQVFVKLKELGRVTDLNLSKSTISDTQLESLNQGGVGTLLVNLDLSNTKITDAGLDKLTNLRLLMSLNLTGTRVSAAAIQRIVNQPRTFGNIKLRLKVKGP